MVEDMSEVLVEDTMTVFRLFCCGWPKPVCGPPSACWLGAAGCERWKGVNRSVCPGRKRDGC